MNKLIKIVLMLETIGGTVFFAALFAAPFALSIKVLAAVALMFISAGVYLLMVHHVATIEGFSILAHQISHPAESAETEVVDRLGVLQGGIRLEGAPRVGYLLLGLWGAWLFCGYLLSDIVI